jgi:hypothetical protein
VRLVSLLLLCLAGSGWLHAADAAKGPIYACTFTPDGWSRADWIRVKNPYDKHFDDWVQQEECITNGAPVSGVPAETRDKEVANTYASMVYKEKITGNLTVTATMAFTNRLAPLIVFTPDLVENPQGLKEHRNHVEVVIFGEGVNIWRHFVQDGKLKCRKAAFAVFPLQKDTRHTLEVTKKGKVLTVSIDGHQFGYLEDALPDPCYVGITACEGLDRFYDFSLRR